ncbi:hypothetical protein [Collinsella ureilytica]|nr:hypothetical protein [Collinsella urealyticum]
MTGKDSRIGTVAVIADAVGVDLVLVDRATGATIGRVDPPAQCS